MVIEEDCTPLLGIGNIRKFKLDLNLLVHGNSFVTSNKINYSIYDRFVIDVKKMFADIFEPDLGHCTKFQIFNQ